jgi:crotonobetainyl-CoA:carnitine CoA-transferase CaiB-like acyl-CoA transferase
LLHCRDGIVYITAGTQEHWSRLCKLMQRPDLYADPRFDTNLARGQNRNVLIAIINEWSAQWSTRELLAELDRLGIPAARYNELPQVFEDAQVQHRRLKVTAPHPVSGQVSLLGSPLAHMSATPANRYVAPPTLGQHTDDILRERLGLSDDEISRLHATKVV